MADAKIKVDWNRWNKNEKKKKNKVGFIGGVGTVFLCYAPLRLVEDYPWPVMLTMFLILSLVMWSALDYEPHED